MIIIDIGHSRTDKGAYNKALDISEWDWNKKVADILHEVSWLKTKIVERKSGIVQLVRDINAEMPSFCLSLHCNSFSNLKATGTETLYYHKSAKSKRCAEIMQKRMVDALGLPDRGIKPKTTQDRGGWQLLHVSSPIVILEPFFLSNPLDVARVKEAWTMYMDAMISGLDQIQKEVL